MFQCDKSGYGVAWLALVLGLFVSAGCGTSAQQAGNASTGEVGPVGKAVVALVPQTTGNIDPALASGGSDLPNIEPLYNRLLETPKDSPALVPGVASSWTISPDAKTVTFEIRQDVRFHNGEILTPNDVVYSMERRSRVSPPRGQTYFQRFLDKVEANGNQVVFHLKESDWTFLSTIASSPGGGGEYSIVPKKYIEQVGDDGFLKAPVGTGPFKFVSGSRQEYLELEAVDYKHFLWQPGVQHLKIVTVAEETTRLAMLRTGEADLAQISVASLKSLGGEVRPITVPNTGGLRLFMFGQADPQNPLSKLEVRQALSLALDREAIAKGIYQGYAHTIGTGLWNPIEPGFPEWAAKPPPYDLEKAKGLLAKGGFPDGKGLKITLHNYEYGVLPAWTQVAPILASQWGKLGIQVELRQWEFASWSIAAGTGKLDPVSVGTHIGNIAGQKGSLGDFLPTAQSYTYASGTADGAYPEIAAMAKQFDRELDPAKRDALRDKILAFDRDNVVFIPMFTQDALWGAGARVVEYTPKPGTFQSGNMWTIKVKP